jgi:hypothetical protein
MPIAAARAPFSKPDTVTTVTSKRAKVEEEDEGRDAGGWKQGCIPRLVDNKDGLTPPKAVVVA